MTPQGEIVNIIELLAHAADLYADHRSEGQQEKIEKLAADLLTVARSAACVRVWRVVESDRGRYGLDDEAQQGPRSGGEGGSNPCEVNAHDRPRYGGNLSGESQ